MYDRGKLTVRASFALKVCTKNSTRTSIVAEAPAEDPGKRKAEVPSLIRCAGNLSKGRGQVYSAGFHVPRFSECKFERRKHRTGITKNNFSFILTAQPTKVTKNRSSDNGGLILKAMKYK